MIKWSDLRTEILEGVLKDPAGNNATPEQMLIWAKWACAEISHHTAESVSQLLICDGSTNKFVLSGDIVDTLEKTGLVIYNDGSSINHLPSLHPESDTLWPVETINGRERKGFFEWPSGVLTLGWTPAVGSLEIRYFRIWEPPSSDDSLLIFPTWMQHPFAYMIAAYAQDPLGAQASNIRQWNQKRDSGEPEHNPLHRQSEFFLKMAYRLLVQATPQDRANFYGQKLRIGSSR